MYVPYENAVIVQFERKAPPLPLIDTSPRPLIPKVPDYDSYRCERLESLTQRGASERALRVRATMRPDQSFNYDKRFLDLLQKTGTEAVLYSTVVSACYCYERKLKLAK